MVVNNKYIVRWPPGKLWINRDKKDYSVAV